MKIGCCVNMLGAADDIIGAKWIETLKKCGYDYVELPLAQVMDLDEAQFASLLALLEKAGIGCEACNNFFPASVRLTGPEASPEAAQAYMEKAIARAAAMGAKVIVFGSSGAKNVPEGFDHGKAFDQVTAVLKKANEICARYGIVIAIEPLNSRESNLIVNLSEGAALAKAVDLPQVKLLVDYYHYALENDLAVIPEEITSILRHMHVAEPEKRGFPRPNDAKFQAFLSQIRLSGYEGRCSIEAFSDHPEDDLKTGIEIMRAYER